VTLLTECSGFCDTVSQS